MFRPAAINKFFKKMSEEISIAKLYLVVFLTGAIVMVLELIGSRILAPSVGTSTFVWASLIGVILGAMSLGYYYGGKIADRDPNLRTFSSLIFSAGFFVFLIIIFRQRILDVAPYLGVKSGSIFAAAFFFGAPSFLLGTVSPYAARLAMKKIETSGRTIGNLYAVSTFGSIVGTFAAGFYLIPHIGSVRILYGLALALFAIAFFCYRPERRKRWGLFFLAAAMLGTAVGVEAMDGNRFLYQSDSTYSNIRVYDTERAGRSLRVMSLENSFDSGMYLDSDDLAFEYSEYYALDELFGGKIRRAAIFGGAAFSVPKEFLRRNSEGTIDVVEIDPKTTEVAKQYFGLRDDERLRITYEDARIFLNEKAKNERGSYDAIYNDAFNSTCSIPSHLTTLEAVREVSDILDEDGVFIINLIASLEGEKSTFFRAEYKTLAQVFGGVYVFPTHDADYDANQAQNIMIVATKQKADPDAIRGAQTEGKLAELLSHYYSAKVETGDVITLTDDFSPVSHYSEPVCNS